ncbi:MAG: NTP transferase domain-containing protein [Desulfofustis sp.]|nr:NTP transferase domain-containing protein [Desulfofustis sp.]
MQAMILAAGYGTRLQPYSLARPKPLFPVLNRPLLLATIERLQAAGCRRILVNCHHLAEQIVAAVAGISGVQLQVEPAILGTGGSLAEARGWLTDEPLLVSNGDIYHTIDFRKLYDAHVRQGNRVTMVVHDCPRFNKVSVTDTRVTGFDAPVGSPGALAFTGVQVIDPDILRDMDGRRPWCIIDHYRRLLDAGTEINCRIDAHCNWTDIGTVAEYLRLHGELLTGGTPIWLELGGPVVDGVLIDSEARLDPGCRVEPWSCIGKVGIPAGAVIARSVLWDGAEVVGDQLIADRLVAPSLHQRNN